MDIFFLMSSFQRYMEMKMSLERNSAGNSLFVCASRC